MSDLPGIVKLILGVIGMPLIVALVLFIYGIISSFQKPK